MTHHIQTGPTAVRWRPYEIALNGPADGNPYLDVTLRVEFRHGDRTVTAHGFHDGDGVYRVRILPDEAGRWTYRTTSDTPALDGHTGGFDCRPAGAGDHGPVRVHDRFHFRYADGTRYLPVGTTLYAWTHQPAPREEQTLRTLAGAPFNKVRMCVFPKSYAHNTGEPERHPFRDGDFSRPDPEFFRHLGWGNLTARELVRRCWEGAVRGGYVAHGETYLADDDVLWWSKGGVLRGESPPRIAFLRAILEDAPGAGLDPLPGSWDLPVGGVGDHWQLAYFGFSQPRFRTFTMPPGLRYRVDVIDTWQMAVTEVPGHFSGTFSVALPGRPYLAVRLTAQPHRTDG